MPLSAREIDQLSDAVQQWRHWVGNDMLDRLGVPGVEERHRVARFKERLLIADDLAARVMQEFFELGPFVVNNQPWLKAGLKLFVSHVAAQKQPLVALSNELEKYGIASFLAHEAIQPGANWRGVLLHALGSMDALLSFHSEGFDASKWCGQEVGFAIARQVPVIPVMAGVIPGGFIEQLQAIQWRPAAIAEVSRAIYENLARHDSSSAAAGLAIARQLKFVGSYDGADFYLRELQQFAQLSEPARNMIHLAVLLNDQVRDCEVVQALIEGR